MPVIFRCRHCHSIIFIFERVGQDCFGLPTPTELINRYDGVCPNCGRRLSIPKLSDIKIVGRVKAPLKTYLEEHINLTLYSNLSESHGGILKVNAVSQ